MGGRAAAVITAVTVSCWLAGVGHAAADPSPAPPAPGPTPDHGIAAAAGPGPQVMDHDGTFTVGSQIMPGVYTSGGPRDGGSCYWRRIGARSDTIENALSKKPQTVRIDPADVAFKTNGCQAWVFSPGAAPPGENPPWLSQLQLRHNLDILNGLAGQSGNGQLPPY